MKFSISSEQRDYFTKHRFIPFSHLLNEGELSELNQAIDSLLASAPKGFALRDLWRSSPLIKKIVCSKRLLQLAFELIQKKPLRLAYDQLIMEARRSSKGMPFLDQGSIQDISCINNLQGLFILCIRDYEPSENTELFEFHAGDGVFITPDVPFPFDTLSPSPHKRYLIIAYGSNYSQYLFEERDPYCHFLKNLGYVFGDKLNDRLHPLLLR
ncbi:MAG: hypothetical protein ACK5MA_02235 [Parachlamydiaceae bacterium]